MWRIWLLFDPRRSIIVIGVFAFAMVMTNHFIQLSTPRYGSWLNEPRGAPAKSAEAPAQPATTVVAQQR